MLPKEERVKELQERFGVHNGRIVPGYRYKNLNWYLVDSTIVNPDHDEWFCYGDVSNEDLERLPPLLNGNEILALGYKELGPDQKYSDFFGDGNGIWVSISALGVEYDFRRDGRTQK